MSEPETWNICPTCERKVHRVVGLRCGVCGDEIVSASVLINRPNDAPTQALRIVADIEDLAVVGGKTVVRDKRGVWWEKPRGRPGQWVRSPGQPEWPQ